MSILISTTTVNGNEIQLVKELNRYYIYWGEVKEHYRAKAELLTPSGRIPSQTSAIKKFLQAARAAEYLKFEKL